MYRLSLSHEVYTNSNADVNVAVTHFLAVQNLQLCSTYYVWRAAIKPSSNLKCSTANNLRSLSQTALLASCCFFSPHQHIHLRHAEWQCGARNERRRRTRFRSPPGRGLPMFWKTGDCFYETSRHLGHFLNGEDAVTDLPESFVLVPNSSPIKTDSDESTFQPHSCHMPRASLL